MPRNDDPEIERWWAVWGEKPATVAVDLPNVTAPIERLTVVAAQPPPQNRAIDEYMQRELTRLERGLDPPPVIVVHSIKQLERDIAKHVNWATPWASLSKAQRRKRRRRR